MALSANFEAELANRIGHADHEDLDVIEAAAVDFMEAIDANLPENRVAVCTPLFESRILDLMQEIASEFR